MISRSAAARYLAAGWWVWLAAPALAASPKVGDPMPEVSAQAFDGQPLDLAAMRGRVLVVNVWATWCAPCRAEMPMLDAFYRRHRSEGVALVGLCADRSRDLEAARKAMTGFAYPAALLSRAKVEDLDEPRVLPQTYVVDGSGVVRAVFGLDGKPLTEPELEAAVRAARPAPASL